MATSEYGRVLAALYALEAAKGMDFKLERVALALQNLGNPQHAFASVHVAGTNGKGSVAAMAHAMLSAAGYRVGLYTSPHLVSFTERIRVGEASIREEEVVELTHEVHAAATVRGIELTFFEFVTVLAFLYFARRAVDLAVIEVGLGGRLDATNVVEPAVAVITTIGLDHEEFLGSTLESIAREKAGIIKPGRPVICGNVPQAVRGVLSRIAESHGAPICWMGEAFSTSPGTPFRFQGMGHDIPNLTLPLRGVYQRGNAATAIAATLSLQQSHPVSDGAIRQGLAEVHWPGRLEVVCEEPLIILDGAHNADGMGTLVRELPAIVDGRKIHVLFGVMRDKRWQAMADTLGRVASRAVLTPVLPPRGEAVERLAAAFARHCAVHIVSDPVCGLEHLLESVDPADAIVVTGSLFLIGAIYPLFFGRSGAPTLVGRSCLISQP